MAYKVPERLYRTTDGRLVRQGDPTAAFLAFVKGQEVPEQQAKREGLLDFEKALKAAEAERAKAAREKAAEEQREKPAEKAAEQTENKQAARPADKAAPRVSRASKRT